VAAEVKAIQLDTVVERVATLGQELKEANGEIAKLKAKIMKAEVADVFNNVEEVNGTSFITVSLENKEMDELRQLADTWRQKGASDIFVVGTASADKANLLVAVSKDANAKGLRAGDIIKAIAPAIQGGGGGRPDMAQAGGKNPSGIPRAFELLKEYLFVGGMPEAVDNFAKNHNFDDVRKIQNALINGFVSDFSKYNTAFDTLKTKMVWDSIPSQLAKDNSKYIFKYIIDKINEDKTLELQEIQQIYNFLLTNDYYYIFSDYELVNKLYQTMVLNNRWDYKIALRYFDYLCFLSWEYEAIIVRDLLLDNHVSLAGEFCLDTELVKDGLSYFRDDAIWRGKDYDSDSIPASISEWVIYYDEEEQRFHKVKPSMIENIIIEVVDAEQGLYFIGKE